MASKNHQPRRQIGWLKIAIALALVGGLVAIALPILQGLLSDQFRLQPNAKIKADETYALNFWVERPIVPDLALWQEAVDQAIEDFRTLYPNVNLNIAFLPPNEAATRLNEAINAGNPPDLFFSADGAQCQFGQLQIPLSLFIDKQERTAWADGLWQQLADAGVVYSLPVAAYPQVFMINQQLFQRAELDTTQLAQTSWSWPDLLAAAEKVASGKVYGYVPTSTGESLLRSLAASSGEPSPFSSNGDLVWSREDLLAFAEVARLFEQAKGLPQQEPNLDANCLDLFLNKRAAIIGPINHRLAGWLWNAAFEKGITPELLPIPQLTTGLHSDVRVVGISVFRQTNYQGHGHTRAAAELAQFLVPRLGSALATLTGALPATAIAAAADSLPYDPASFAIYSQVAHAPNLPYAYGPTAGLSEEHWRLAITPAWERLVQGVYTAEQFAEAVLSELAMATVAGP